MVICPDCGKEVTNAKFCSNCGATLKPPVEEAVEVVEDNVPVEVNGDVIDVEVKETIDEKLVGGLVIKYQGKIIDGSLFTKQESLKEYLKK